MSIFIILKRSHCKRPAFSSRFEGRGAECVPRLLTSAVHFAWGGSSLFSPPILPNAPSQVSIVWTMHRQLLVCACAATAPRSSWWPMGPWFDSSVRLWRRVSRDTRGVAGARGHREAIPTHTLTYIHIHTDTASQHQPKFATAMRTTGSFPAAAGAAGLLVLVAACGWAAPASAQSLVNQAVMTSADSTAIFGAGCKLTLGVPCKQSSLVSAHADYPLPI